MKSYPTASRVAAILSDILADLAFMFPGPDEHALRRPEESWVESTIEYSGPRSGRLRLRCTSAFSVMLASNLLGIDSDDPDVPRKADDAVGELMNIVCGHVVTALHGADAAFDLSLPQTNPLDDAPDWRADEREADATIFVEGQVVQLLHTLEPSWAAGTRA